MFPTAHCQQKSVGFFYFVYVSLVKKNIKVGKKSFFLKKKKKKNWFLWVYKSKFKQIKNPEHPFIVIGKWETCAKFQQKCLNLG